MLGNPRLWSGLLALAALGVPSARAAALPEWDPRKLGATGDGHTYDTAALQQAIELAHQAGAGVVHLTAGTYLTGTIDLRSGVTLHLDAGATLLGGPHLADYRRGNWPALVKARNADNVAIEGAGVIDGQGQIVAAESVRFGHAKRYLDFFPDLKPGEPIQRLDGHGRSTAFDPWKMQRDGTLEAALFGADNEGKIYRVGEFVRPQVLEFWNCHHVRIDGITVKNAACWVETYRDCEDLTITNLKVRSTAYWNNDGIDVVDCRRVRIEHCDIDSADDGICLKSETDGRLCEDVTITDCRIRASASGFKMGTASRGGFRHIRVSHLEVFNTYRSAVALESVDGGIIADIVVDGVRSRHTGSVLFIRLGHRAKERSPGTVRDVLLENFVADVPADSPDAGYEFPGPPTEHPTNLLPSVIAGLPGAPIEGVTLRNIAIDFAGGGNPRIAERRLDQLALIHEREGGYPEYSMFGELPAWGLYLRHAAGIRLEHVTLRLRQPDYRPAVVADAVAGLSLDHVAVRAPATDAGIVLHAVSAETDQYLELPSGRGVQVQTP